MLDLNNVKEQIQTIFEAANTTTAATYLSNGLETRVQKIFKVNPMMIPPQASLIPYVTIYVDNKSIENTNISVSQSAGKRRADIDLKVLGVVWNSTFNAVDEDPADEDCEALMENIEEILRANSTLNGVAVWAYPSAVTYHQVSINEETHLRAGIMNLKATFYY